MSTGVRFHIFVSGRVQGVFFRTSAQEKAGEFHVSGWAKNLPDGRVEIVCEGEDENIKQFIEWCRQGPSLAQVESVESKKENWTEEFERFEI